VPGRFFSFGLNHSGGVALRWWRDQFGAAEISEAAARGIEAYAVMDERLPTGPSPVLVLPHFTGRGTPSCDLAARGAVLGLTLANSRHEVFKGLLEGLCFELRANLEAWQAAGVRVDELVAVGGGAKSAAWVQLKADVLGRPVRTLRCPEAAALGAALLAGTAVGVYASLEEAVARAVAPDRQFEPAAHRAAHYQDRWSVYQQVAAALRSMNPLL
jgi:sugar (pentulose or hexulose) kinase